MITPNISTNDLKQFKSLYQEAIRSNKSYFLWNGEPVLTGYAKYLIENHENNQDSDHPLKSEI